MSEVIDINTRRSIDVTHGSYRHKDVHTPRTQREANIDWRVWENRAEPNETWGRVLFEALCYALFFLGCYYVLPILTGMVADWWIGR